MLFILLISDLSNFGHIKYEEYIYPLPVQLLGYAITGASLIWIPIMAILQQRKGDNSSSNADSAAWLLKPTAVRNCSKPLLKIETAKRHLLELSWPI